MTIMRVAIGRRNAQDPDSSDQLLMSYINDVINLYMPHDVKLFEQFGTLVFDIDENGQSGTNDGVYNLSGITGASEFVNYSLEAFISLKDPVNESVSWNSLDIYQDPGEFYSIWGVNNYGILITGYPTNMLYYGTQFVFRTIPNDTYQIQIYGYKLNDTLAGSGSELPFSYWCRYLAYFAALNYVRDYRFEDSTINRIERTLAHERKYLLTHTHNQCKLNRAFPRF